jgi:hypothetical protein
MMMNRDREFLLHSDHGESGPHHPPAAVGRKPVALFVHRATQQWIVRDPEGELWRLESADDPWASRKPFQRAEEAELELVPGHYRYLLNLPF